MRVAFALALLAAGGASVLLSEERPAVSGTASLAVLNRYIFRGYRFGGGPVLQPYLTAAFAGFSASAWVNVDLKEASTPNFTPDRDGRASYNETDLSMSYGFGAGPVGGFVGFVYYGTKYARDTIEIFAGATLSVLGKPTLTVYRDVKAYPGTYLNLAWTPSIALAEGLSLDLGASAGYYAGSSAYWRTFDPATEEYAGPPYRAFHDGMVKAGLTVDVGGGWSVQPALQYYFPLSSAAKRAAGAPGGTVNGPLEGVAVFGATLVRAF